MSRDEPGWDVAFSEELRQLAIDQAAELKAARIAGAVSVGFSPEQAAWLAEQQPTR